MNKWTTSDGTVISRILSSNMPLIVSNTNHAKMLIDTGRASSCNRILDKLDRFWGEAPLEMIVLTHTHKDHIENLSPILSKYAAQVLVHNSEIRNLSGFPSQTNLVGFSERYNLNDHGVNGFVIHTPGHTSGSSAVVINEEIALIGDTLGDFKAKPYAKNQKRVTQIQLTSLETLINLNCKLYIPAHGAIVYTHNELATLYSNYTKK